ncbi:MAG: DEAD/DEAH box helicase family protein, partial [Deltaproteobacteria bacterium]|nr:DEAD/DEAH box helicase family protein [Deltaproteobacteria bacterium]
GTLGGGRARLNGRLDVAMIQSLVRGGEVDDRIAQYGHVLIDECHHVPAFAFERVVSATPARYVVGLSATPYRRDGHHPILFMQCGPVRHAIDSRVTAA